MKPLIIFDCDGVLVETEAVANNRMAEIFTSMGYKISGTECRHKFQGQSMKSVCETVSKAIETTIHAKDIRDEVKESLSINIKAIEGIEDVVSSLRKQGFDICVASSGSVPKMHTTLGQTNMLSEFKDVMFSADQVAQGKPHPDVFIFAAKNMGYKPNQCIVIEDSIPGVQAAVAANMKVLGYCGDAFTSLENMAEAGAQVIMEMKDILSFVEDY